MDQLTGLIQTVNQHRIHFQCTELVHQYYMETAYVVYSTNSNNAYYLRM